MLKKLIGLFSVLFMGLYQLPVFADIAADPMPRSNGEYYSSLGVVGVIVLIIVIVSGFSLYRLWQKAKDNHEEGENVQ